MRRSASHFLPEFFGHFARIGARCFRKSRHPHLVYQRPTRSPSRPARSCVFDPPANRSRARICTTPAVPHVTAVRALYDDHQQLLGNISDVLLNHNIRKSNSAPGSLPGELQLGISQPDGSGPLQEFGGDRLDHHAPPTASTASRKQLSHFALRSSSEDLSSFLAAGSVCRVLPSPMPDVRPGCFPLHSQDADRLAAARPQGLPARGSGLCGWRWMRRGLRPQRP